MFNIMDYGLCTKQQQNCKTSNDTISSCYMFKTSMRNNLFLNINYITVFRIKFIFVTVKLPLQRLQNQIIVKLCVSSVSESKQSGSITISHSRRYCQVTVVTIGRKRLVPGHWGTPGQQGTASQRPYTVQPREIQAEPNIMQQ